MAEIILNVKLTNTLAKKQLNDLKTAIEQIGEGLSKVKVNTNLTKQINALTNNYKALAKAAQTVAKTDNKNEIQKQKLIKATADANRATLNEQKAQIQLKTAIDKTTEATKKNSDAIKDNTKKNLENRQSLLSMMQGFLQWQIAAMAVMKPLNLIRNAWTSLNETLQKTEDTVIALQRVLPSGSASDQDVANKLYDLAQKYGQTFENASELATNFARTGMSWNDTIKATESALLALNVAELDATQASDGLIAIMSQFKLSASDLTNVIDTLNKTADNFPVTTEKILTALQRTGSAANNAKLSLEETIGLITTLSKNTGRSGENIGTALNSLIQYSSKSSSLDVFASLDERTSDVVGKYRKGAATILDVWQEVSRVINSMDERQESILSGLIGDDEIKNLEQELQDELGDIFETVSDVYGTANTFRKNYFIALLGDMKTVQEAIDTASDAQGYSQKENEKYLDTYTAKVNKLQAQWQKLANDEQGLLSIKKFLVDIASLVLDFTKKIGGLRTVFLALGTTLWAVFGNKVINNIKKMGSSIKQMFVELKAGVVSLNSVLGIIGIIATTISLIDGILSNFKKEDTTATDIAEAASNLEQLSEKFSKIDADTKKTKNQLAALNDILSDESSTEEEVSKAKSELLDIQNDLIESNKSYLSSIDLINLSYQEQLGLLDKVSELQKRQAVKDWIKENQTGINAAEGYLVNPIGNWRFDKDTQSAYEDSAFQKWLRKQGYEVWSSGKDFGSDPLGWFGEGFTGLFGAENYYTTTSATKGKTREEVIKLLNDLYEKAKAEGRADFAGIIGYEIGLANNETYKESQKIIYGDKNASSWIERLTQQQREQFVSGELSWSDIKELLGITEDIVDVTKTWEEQSSKVLSNYQDILDTINKTLDTQQGILDVEEKRKALEDARNNRNVRVFNATTGNWELQADQKAIDKAEKDYQNAVWNNLQNEIKDGNLTVAQIFDKVKDISEDLPNLANIIREALIKEGYNVPAFDNGGVLQGLGGIKATVGDEIVLPPEITRKILQPTSNEQFSAFVKDLGLLFGASHQVMDMRSGMVANTSSSDNSINNSNNTFVINGVPFSREMAEKHTVVELFEMAAELQN